VNQASFTKETSEEHDNFKNLFNAINDFVFILDLEGNIVEINNAVTSVLGYSKDELYGKSVLLVHPPACRKEASENVQGMISGKKDTCLLQLLSKQGMHIPVETKVYSGRWNHEKVLIGISRNLSEIALSNEKFGRVFDENQTLMAVSEMTTGKFVNVNKRFLEVLGYKESEVIGNSSLELDIFDDFARWNELFEKVQKQTSLDNEHVLLRTKYGKPVHCLFFASIIQIQTYNYLLTSAIDITLSKQIDQKLKNSLGHQTLLADISQTLLSIDEFDEKLSSILVDLGYHTGVSRVYIFEDDISGKFTNNTYEWCNLGISEQIDELQDIPYEIVPSWKKIFSEKGRVFSTNILELPEDLIVILEPQGVKSILVFPLYVQNNFFGFVGFDECQKEKVWEHDEVELLRTVSGIISNSFERKILKSQLEESEMRLKLAVDNTETGLWDWNVQTDDVIFNDSWGKMLGYECGDLPPNCNSWERLIHPDDKENVFMVLDEHLQGKREYYEVTHRLLTKSNEWKWILDKGKVIEYDSNNKPLRAVGTMVNVDYQKKIEEELRCTNITKDKFFSIIAHDLKGPVGSIMQSSELLVEIIDEDESVDMEELYKCLVSQKELATSTFWLLDNLLSWASFNSEQIKFLPENVNLKSLIDENVLHIRLRAEKKNISIVFDCGENLSVFADRDMVNLIIRNLLSNALKFTVMDGGISIILEQENQSVTVKIIDSGVGISSGNIEKILSSTNFYSTFGTASEKGTGLGLKLCRSFVEQNNGTFNIESQVDKGSIFSFTLPLFEDVS
jgi:PAS domain S-box-containing protein